MSKNLLIVESPKKARTIQKFLKGNWNVRASYGHVRQLARDGEDQLGFDLSVALPSDTEIKVLGRGTSQEKG